jgi:hypothetical protein
VEGMGTLEEKNVEKLSELIEFLKMAYDKYGDMEVATQYDGIRCLVNEISIFEYESGNKAVYLFDS